MDNHEKHDRLCNDITPVTLADSSEAILADSNIRLVINLCSVQFSAETKCQLSVIVERIQLIEADSDVAGAAHYSFN